MDYSKLTKVVDSKVRINDGENGKYDYLAAETADIVELIQDGEIDLDQYSTREEAEEDLNDKLWAEDSVTGNGSGSYWFNTWKAEEAICHNLDLLAEACEEFGDTTGILSKGAEAADVTIRCYLLGQAISAALDQVGFEEAEDEEVEDEEVEDNEAVEEETQTEE